MTKDNGSAVKYTPNQRALSSTVEPIGEIKSDTRSEPRLCRTEYETHEIKGAGIIEK
jgi:hypothetical protein